MEGTGNGSGKWSLILYLTPVLSFFLLVNQSRGWRAGEGDNDPMKAESSRLWAIGIKELG